MKRMSFLLLMLVPMFAFAQMNVKRNYKPKYKVECLNSLVKDSSGTNIYKDSIISVEVSMAFSLDYLLFYLWNQTDERVTLEWENMRINGSKIAFRDDCVYQMNNPRADEVIMARAFSTKTLYLRYNSLIPIIDKNKLKKEAQKLYIDVPIRYRDKIYDIHTEWIVDKAKKDVSK